MKKQFKIGDRVQITEFENIEKLIGEKGVIVDFDNDGDALLKMDNNVGTYSYSRFSNYVSDRNDLVILDARFNQKIKHI